MSKDRENFIIPDGNYYEDPYIPSPEEARNYLAISLSPAEAQHILVKMWGED